MARAFREGVEEKKKMKMTIRQRFWKPMRKFESLTSRATQIRQSMGPIVDVPALVRIEDEHWVFERIDEATLQHLTHRLVLHSEEGETTLGVTADFETALQVAKCMAEQQQKVVMIRSL